MKTNALKAWEIQPQPSQLQLLELEITMDAQLKAEEYVKSAKVDLGGE